MKRTARAGALALGIVGLLVLVAMAARNGHPSTGGRVSSRPVPNTVQDSFVTLLAIAYVIVLAAIVIGFFRYRHRWKEKRSNWLSNFLLVTLLMLVATAIGYYGMTHSNLRHRITQAQTQQAEAQRKGGARLRQRLPLPFLRCRSYRAPAHAFSGRRWIRPPEARDCPWHAPCLWRVVPPTQAPAR